MNFYISLIILTELMMIAMMIHVINYSGFTKQQKTWYILTFAAVMLCSAAEFLVHSGFYSPNLKIQLIIVTVIQFSIAPMLGVFFSGALGLHKQAKIATYVFLINFVIEVILAPFGLIFYFDSTGYHRGSLFLIYELFYIVSLLYLMVSMFVVGKRFRHRDSLTIANVIVILIAGIIPMAVFQTNVTYIAIAIRRR